MQQKYKILTVFIKENIVGIYRIYNSQVHFICFSWIMCEKSCLILTIMMCSICLQADISRVFFNVLMKALHNVDDGIQIYSYTFLLNILVTLNFWYKFIDAFF